MKLCNFARYAFGDSRKPSTDSASLIEEIVHSQMASLVFAFINATFWFLSSSMKYLQRETVREQMGMWKVLEAGNVVYFM